MNKTDIPACSELHFSWEKQPADILKSKVYSVFIQWKVVGDLQNSNTGKGQGEGVGGGQERFHREGVLH